MKKELFGLLKNNCSYTFAKMNLSTNSHHSIHTQLPSDSSITRVRVWRSGYFMSEKSSSQTRFVPTSAGMAIMLPYLKNAPANIGHVSIETNEIYASLWPNDALTILTKLKAMPGRLHSRTNGPFVDEQHEDRPPDILVDLHTLATADIKEKLNEFEKLGKNYHMFGRNHYLNDLGTNNCSGLAYDLLVCGGLKRLINRSHFVLENIVVTPNNLAHLILAAKEQEIKLGKPSNKPG